MAFGFVAALFMQLPLYAFSSLEFLQAIAALFEIGFNQQLRKN
jgi:hypothetical protein